MTSTIKYKGSTILEITNDEKLLSTTSKWLEDDIYIKDDSLTYERLETGYPTGAVTSTSTTISRLYAYAYSNITSYTNTNVTSISAGYLFYYASNLETISLPNLTSVTGTRIFYGCSSLTTVDFGKAPYIMNYQFGNCSSINTVILRKTDAVVEPYKWNVSVFGNIYINPTDATIYVPSALISSYQTATYWSNAYAAGVVFAPIEGSIYEL